MIDTSECRLDPKQTRHLLDHIDARWKHCVVCGSQQFNLFALMTLRFTDDLNTLIDSKRPERPCASLICAGCGNVVVIDLISIGVWKVPDKRATTTARGPYR